MRRPISWIEKTPEGKKEIRVTVTPTEIKWQFLFPNAEKWDYTTLPSEEDWDTLDDKLANLKQRGHCLDAEIEYAKKRIATTDSSKPTSQQKRAK